MPAYVGLFSCSIVEVHVLLVDGFVFENGTRTATSAVPGRQLASLSIGGVPTYAVILGLCVHMRDAGSSVNVL